MIKKDLLEYIIAHSEQEPDYLKEIYQKTVQTFVDWHMCVGYLVGRFISFISRLYKPNNILEIGTYTGYSALCLAEGLSEKGYLLTIEINDELEEVIIENIQKSPYKDKIKLLIGDAKLIIKNLNETFDLIFIDGKKEEYPVYYDLCIEKLKRGGVMIADNTIWYEKVLEENKNADTIGIIEFNKKVKNDKRVSSIILPIKDGVSLIIKK